MGLRRHHGFHRKRGGVALTLSDAEREMLDDLLGQLIEMISPDPLDKPQDPLAALVGITPDARMPEDPALARLLPDAYADAEMAAEFRRFTDADLRRTKITNASRARASLQRAGTIQLDASESAAWLTALNDLRLVLGTRLEVSEDGYPDLGTLPEPVSQMYLIYDWLTYLQDRLVGALTASR